MQVMFLAGMEGAYSLRMMALVLAGLATISTCSGAPGRQVRGPTCNFTIPPAPAERQPSPGAAP
jgi:hypothetical protein